MTDRNWDALLPGLDAVDAIVGREPTWIVRSGIGLIFAVTLALFGVAWFIAYPDRLSGEIVLTSEEPPAELVASVSGRIEALYLTDSSVVDEHQPIMLLESDVSIVNLRQAETRFASVRGTSTCPASADSPSAKSLTFDRLGELQASYNAWVKAVGDFYRFCRNEALSIQVAETLETIRQYSELERLLQRKESVLQRRLDLKELELEQFRILSRDGLIPSVEVTQVQSESLNLQAVLEDIAIDRRLHSLNSTRLESQLDIYRNAHTQRESELLASSAAAASAFSSALTSWKNRYLVRAPFHGIVSMSDYWSVNQHVSAGDTLVRVYRASNLVVGKLVLDPIGAGNVILKQRVEISLDEFPPMQFGRLTGEVSAISSIANGDGYLVTVSLPKDLVSSYGIPIPNSPELSGTALIITQDRRLLDRLFGRLLLLVSS